MFSAIVFEHSSNEFTAAIGKLIVRVFPVIRRTHANYGQTNPQPSEITITKKYVERPVSVTVISNNLQLYSVH